MGVILIAVDMLGSVRQPHRWFPDETTACANYEDYDRELNGTCTDPRLRMAIHAVPDDRHWEKNCPSVQSNLGYAPDRSCRWNVCRCAEMGLPIKKHPHLP